MTEIDIVRTNHLVDPHLEIWRWEIPVYLFLGGMTAGLMILSSLAQLRGAGRSKWVRWMPFLAPAALSVGMLALFLDLEHRLHVWRFYLAFRPSSPMSWGAWILLAIYPATLLAGLGNLSDDEARRLVSRGQLRALRLGRLVDAARGLALRHPEGLRRANLVLGIGLGVYTGILLGTLSARAAWNSAVLGPLFLASGFSSGAALLLLLPLRDEEHGFLERADKLAIAVEASLLFLWLVGLATGGAAAREAAALFLGGRYTAAFWSLVVVAGLAVPATMALLRHRLHLAVTRAVPVLVLGGALALRWILVAAGQA